MVNSSREKIAFYSTCFTEVFNGFISRNLTFYSLDLFRCVWVEIRSFLTKYHYYYQTMSIFVACSNDMSITSKRFHENVLFSSLEENLNWPLLAGGNDFERDENGLSRKTEQDSITLVIPVTSWNTKTAHYLYVRGTGLIYLKYFYGERAPYFKTKMESAIENISCQAKFIPFLEFIFWRCNKGLSPCTCMVELL